MGRIMRWILVLAAVALLPGCAAFRHRVEDVDVEEGRTYDEQYGHRDLRELSSDLTQQLLGSGFLQQQEEQPILMIAGIRNDTDEYIDTRSITDRMRVLLMDSGKLRSVNEARRRELMEEQGYQAEHVEPTQQVAIGRQLGAQYMMSGAFSKIARSSPRQIRISRRRLNYYKMTLEVTDLQTGEIMWIAEREFAREAREPLFRW
jgi:penicillin-binding protein activator